LNYKGLGVGAGFERTTKMKSENENDHFCKSEGRVRFLGSFFLKNEPKMAQKWLL
jgi:hypothetical protein